MSIHTLQAGEVDEPCLCTRCRQERLADRACAHVDYIPGCPATTAPDPKPRTLLSVTITSVEVWMTTPVVLMLIASALMMLLAITMWDDPSDVMAYCQGVSSV